jgi:hypothetical protein
MLFQLLPFLVVLMEVERGVPQGGVHVDILKAGQWIVKRQVTCFIVFSTG